MGKKPNLYYGHIPDNAREGTADICIRIYLDIDTLREEEELDEGAVITTFLQQEQFIRRIVLQKVTAKK